MVKPLMRLLCVGYISPSRPQVAAWADAKTRHSSAQLAADGAFFRNGGRSLSSVPLDFRATVGPIFGPLPPTRIGKPFLPYSAVISAGPMAPE